VTVTHGAHEIADVEENFWVTIRNLTKVVKVHPYPQELGNIECRL